MKFPASYDIIETPVKQDEQPKATFGFPVEFSVPKKQKKSSKSNEPVEG